MKTIKYEDYKYISGGDSTDSYAQINNEFTINSNEFPMLGPYNMSILLSENKELLIQKIQNTVPNEAACVIVFESIEI